MPAVPGVRDNTGSRIQPFLFSLIYTADLAGINALTDECLNMRSAGDLQVFQ